MPRPRKYDDPFVFSVKAERAAVQRAREIAEADGRTLNEVMENFISSYSAVNSSYTELERKVKDQRSVVSREQTKLAALEFRLKQKIGDIPAPHVKYYRDHRGEWSDDQFSEFCMGSAEKLKVDPEFFKKRIVELAEETK